MMFLDYCIAIYIDCNAWLYFLALGQRHSELQEI